MSSPQMAAFKRLFFPLNTMIPLATRSQHSQVGQGVPQKNLGLALQEVWLVLTKEGRGGAAGGWLWRKLTWPV